MRLRSEVDLGVRLARRVLTAARSRCGDLSSQLLDLREGDCEGGGEVAVR